MGQLEPPELAWPCGGVQSGALCSASGYGFLAIQQWAEMAAEQFMLQRVWPSSAYRPTWKDYLDQLFIEVLVKHPHVGQELFMRMAKALPGDGFARFMAEQANWRDWIKVIGAMPKRMFIQQAMAKSLLTPTNAKLKPL